MTKPPHFQIHSAVTIVGEQVFTGLIDKRGKPEYRTITPDKELCQFAAEWKKSPVPEHHFRKAFREMEEACLKSAMDAGLIQCR